MKCKDIQDLILTEYLDNLIDDVKRSQVEHHISSCPRCRELLALAKGAAIEPFNKAEKVNISQDVVWQNVLRDIEDNKAEGSIWDPLLGFIERLRSSIFLPRPAIAFGTLALLLIMAVSFKQVSLFNIAQRNNSEEIEYYASLSSSLADTKEGFNTDIENYLL